MTDAWPRSASMPAIPHSLPTDAISPYFPLCPGWRPGPLEARTVLMRSHHPASRRWLSRICCPSGAIRNSASIGAVWRSASVIADPASQGASRIRSSSADRQTSALGSDLLLVRSRAARRARNALDVDVPDERPVNVAVGDADDLVHASASLRFGRLQRRPRKRFVDVAGDRPGLIKAEAGMLEGRNLAERVARQIFPRRTA